MDKQPTMRVNLDEIRLGTTCKFDISDSDEVLLLGSGQPFTKTIREQIRKRGISYLDVHPDDAPELLGEDSGQAKAVTASVDGKLVNRRIDRRHEPYCNHRAERFASAVASAIGKIESIGEQIHSLSSSAVYELCEIPLSLTEMALEDSDQSIAAQTLNGTEQASDFSVAKRCTNLAALAINTGIEMELSESEVKHLGTAGLLHDMALFQMPEKFRNTTIALSKDELWEFKKHPIIAGELFAKFSVIPDEVRLIVSQIHERCDGSGYPRGLGSNVTHPLSRVLNLLDSYLSLITPGPGRPSVVPHDAITLLLHEGGRGKFEAAPMRAMLSTMSLFPIGSNVSLSNGQTGTVIRRDGDNYFKPIVQVDDNGQETKVVMKDSPHSIVGPVATDEKRQMRLTSDMTKTLTLDLLES